MREFWETQYDFNDRNDFLTNTFSGNPANPRPSTTGGVLAWDNVNAAGGDLIAFSNLLKQVNDEADPNQTINRFAMAMAQKLCYYANSSECVESDPEYRRIALAFANSSYDFGTLITELFASPLVTDASDTATFDADGVLFGAGAVGLRALASGLPAWFIANPRKATAQSLQCAITATDKLQRLIVCVSSNGVQKAFLDAFANTQTQVRNLSASLSSLLSSISNDSIAGQALAAAALIAANVTPVVAVRIPFGGDNHTDQNLQAEADQHVTGCAGIQSVITALSSNGLALTDKVTFATWNVFGRNLNGIDKVAQRAGRDHYGNHSIGVMIGKNVAPGVIGGVAPLASSSGGVTSGSLAAADIDSASGAAAAGGDIPGASTHIAYARTLGVALGIPSAQVSSDLIVGAGGKVVNAALSGVSG